MRMLMVVAFSSAALLSPILAAGQETAAPAAPAATAATDSSAVNLDEIICKNSAPPTGSRLGGGRECHTQREWNRRQQESEDITRRQQREGYRSPGG